MELEGKVAIVTGGGRGIGRAIAARLARAGAAVAIADRNVGRATESADALAREGRRTLALGVDVTVRAQVEEMARRVVAELGGIDVLVNNAGWTIAGPFMEMDPAQWRTVIDVNLVGAIACSRAVLEHMIPRRAGKIVNIASDAGRVGFLGEAVYSAAKAGLLGFTKSLALEMGPHGVAVNCVCPGVTETPLIAEGMRTNPAFAKEIEKIVQGTPLGRIGRPDDVAAAVLFLCARGSDFVTGQILSVNGGQVMAG